MYYIKKLVNNFVIKYIFELAIKFENEKYVIYAIFSTDIFFCR